jgi:hypothetical protein
MLCVRAVCCLPLPRRTRFKRSTRGSPCCVRTVCVSPATHATSDMLYRDLFVRRTPTHTVILNKFPVARSHASVVPRWTLLCARDFVRRVLLCAVGHVHEPVRVPGVPHGHPRLCDAVAGVGLCPHCSDSVRPILMVFCLLQRGRVAGTWVL